MACMASSATTVAIMRIYSGWSVYPRVWLMGVMAMNIPPKKVSESTPTIVSDVQNTVFGFSSCLLANRKNVVSMPNVSITRISAV